MSVYLERVYSSLSFQLCVLSSLNLFPENKSFLLSSSINLCSVGRIQVVLLTKTAPTFHQKMIYFYKNNDESSFRLSSLFLSPLGVIYTWASLRRILIKMTVLRRRKHEKKWLEHYLLGAFLGPHTISLVLQIINVSGVGIKKGIKKRPYGRVHQRIMICCYLQKKKGKKGGWEWGRVEKWLEHC